MILSCQKITKSFGTNNILSDVSFHIEEREKVALVGTNGSGKSTLLNILAGSLPSDSGVINIAKGKSLGYLEQHQEMAGENSIYEELLSVKRPILELEKKIRDTEQLMKHATGQNLESLMSTYTKLSHQFEEQNGYAYKSEIMGVIKGLGFDEGDMHRQAAKLSGGQKTRVALGKLLLLNPDILLLDEPTNHLDMDSIHWLETFLSRYDGAILIVSHDRYFLDRIATKVLSLENHQMTSFAGNYSTFAEKRAALYQAQQNAYRNQQQELKHQEDVIAKLRSFNREKSIRRAESREKMLAKITPIDKPLEINTEMNISLTPNTKSGKDVLNINELSKSFKDIRLFNDLSFTISRGERVAIIGQNGTGKTTILKIINAIVAPDAGTISLGSNVHVGYYDQEHQLLDPNKTIFAEISDAYPNLSNTKIRNVLAAFLFTDDDVFQKIDTLSGGERGRVALAKLMLSNANFLILDEPTNHLDIISKEVLERALNLYTGTVLFVSHDRYFINKTATRILDLVNKKIVNYIGNYDYYLDKKDELTNIYAPVSVESNTSTPSNENQLSWQQQKEASAAMRKRQNELSRLETEIERLEEREKAIDEQFELPSIACNVVKCQELSLEKEEITRKLTQCYEAWDELA